MMMSRGVGGGHFRKKIDAGVDATLSDVTHEGLYGDYYFVTGEEKEKDFKPSYSFAVVRDPISNELQHYLCVGLNSKFDGEGIHKYGRPRVQLVICLDTSGSMNCEFDKVKAGDENLSKLEAAKKSLFVLMEHLRKDDMFALITFDEESHVIQSLARWDSIDLEKLKRDVTALQPSGGTALSVGFVTAASMLEDEAKKQRAAAAAASAKGEVAQQRPLERRIMFLTDMCPTAGETRADGLFGIADRNAKVGIFSTFIGVGLDFNTELVNHITKNILAASYFSVLSESDFRKQMAEDFDYLVCPLVFNVTLALKCKSKAVCIDRIYGSPESDEESGELMKVCTLFPSARLNGETKGGVVLIKLNINGKQVEGLGAPGGAGGPDPAKAKAGEAEAENKDEEIVMVEGAVDKTKLELAVSFSARDSEGLEKQVSSVDLHWHNAPYFENDGVRKALLLAQFVNVVEALLAGSKLSKDTGVPVGLTAKQRKAKDKKARSGAFKIDKATAVAVQAFLDHFEKEAAVLKDVKLKKEHEVLKKLLKQGTDADAAVDSSTTDSSTMDDIYS